VSDIVIRRILTIDGGGLKGMVPAAFLATIESHVERPLHEYFDLIVGTSTGGIIAAGLAMGKSAREIVALYKESGPLIFPTVKLYSRLWLGLTGLVRAKYPTAMLRERLEKYFPNMIIGDARTRLVIPSWDPRRQSVYIWKTRHCGRFRTDHSKSIVEALIATASAPTYFASAPDMGGTGLIDGGVWANNPMLVAAVEAAGVLRWDVESVRMLSLGCVREDNIPPSSGGCLRWASEGPRLFMQGQGSGALGGAYLLLRDRPLRPGRVFRIEASAPKGYFTLDGAAALEEMQLLGESLARSHLDQVRSVLSGPPAVPFRSLPADAPDDAIA
jgi:predicted acylesterase/phospholipase RssA